ncbi:MAG: IS66 family transposase ISMrsp5 [Holosporales bacterium]
MKIQSFDVRNVLDSVKHEIEKDKTISASLTSLLTIMLMLFEVLIDKLSKNSSIPPSQDPNRRKESKKKDQKPGGQKGHIGTTLEKTKNPDEIVDLYVNLKSLPKGSYKDDGYEARQVVDIIFKKKITEYRAHRVIDAKGIRHKAPFPDKVKSPIQYGDSVKAHSVYLSMFQLIPYERLQDYFINQLQIPLSTGTLCNFNKEAFQLLEGFETLLKQKLIDSDVVNLDQVPN